MSEIRVVKFNIKDFLVDLLCSKVTGQEDEYNELIDKFDSFYTNSNLNTKKGVYNYMNKKSIIVRDNKGLAKDLLRIMV